jgi:hypothetical protein
MLLNSSCFITKIGRICLLYIAAIITYSAAANNPEQTLIVMGSDIKTCTNLSSQFCNEKSTLTNQRSAQFKLTSKAIKTLQAHWPTANNDHKEATVKNLQRLLNSHPTPLTKKELLWAWRDIASFQMSELSEAEFNYVINMLEIAVKNTQSITELDIENSTLAQTWLIDTLDFAKASLQVKSKQPTLLIVTAAAPDPYAHAAYYETVLSDTGINTKWLPLTPALTWALNRGQCENLDAYRNKIMALYNRETVYPERTKAEYALCKQGIEQLNQRITNSTGVLLAGSENNNVLRKSLFDKHNNPTPWGLAIANAPVLISSGNSANILANHQLNAQIQSPNTQPPQNTSTKIQAGLGAFTFGFLSNEFSEKNKTAMFNGILNTSTFEHVFGIDEQTSLVVIKSARGNIITVLGSRGVVNLRAQAAMQYQYSYWPVGAVIEQTDTTFVLSQRSKNNALASVKIPPLPIQRFSDIFKDSRLRSLTQAMCLSQEKSTVGQQNDHLITLSAQHSTHYYRLNPTAYGCATQQLNLSITMIE